MFVHKERIFIFLCATVMALLPAISIQAPRFSTLDIVRIRLNSSATSNIGEVRFGIWSFCLHRTSFEGEICDSFSPCNLNGTLRLCSAPKYGYDFQISTDGEDVQSEGITPAWTRALPSHAAASVMMIVCLFFLCIDRPDTLLYIVTILIAIITFFCDIAVITHVQLLTKKLVSMGLAEKEVNGPGFALQTISGVFLILEFAWYVCEECDTVDTPSISLPPTSTSLPITISLSTPARPPVSIVQGSLELDKMRHELFSHSRSPSPIPSPVPAFPKPHRKATDGLPGKECPICMERGKNLSELSCKHIFCTECISKSVGMYGRCPMCNKNARKPDVRRVSMSSFV